MERCPIFFLETNTLLTSVFFKNNFFLHMFSAPTKVDNRNFYNKNFKKTLRKKVFNMEHESSRKSFFLSKTVQTTQLCWKLASKFLNFTRTQWWTFWCRNTFVVFSFFFLFPQTSTLIWPKKRGNRHFLRTSHRSLYFWDEFVFHTKKTFGDSYSI